MVLTSTTIFLIIVSGGIVGFALGLLGGGGSILAVPLLLYVVGVHNPHVVIGTSAFAVAVNAFLNLIPHWRAGHVRLKPAISFAIPGAVAAFAGSTLGKLVNGKDLLFVFALFMIVMAVMMVRRKRPVDATVSAVHKGGWRIWVTAIAVGLLSGFFGIGGGFLIVPGLMFSTGMPMIAAIGSSLLSVGAFGLTTAVSYALSGLVDGWMVVLFGCGGVAGGLIGTLLATRLSKSRMALQYTFSSIIVMVALYMLYINH